MAVRFDNIADELGRTTNLPPIASFTIMGWVRATTSTAIGTIFGFGVVTAADFYQMMYHSTGDVMRIYNGATGVSGTTVLLDGTWYHFAITVSGTGAGQCLGYLNGVLEVTHAGDAANTAAELTIGRSLDDTEFFNGRIAAVKIWDVALTVPEILDEFKQYYPVRTTNLNAFYPLFDDITGIDKSGNGRNMTVAGTLTHEGGPPIPWVDKKITKPNILRPAIFSPGRAR